jgi:Carboxypeptidase regulatory-like domain
MIGRDKRVAVSEQAGVLRSGRWPLTRGPRRGPPIHGALILLLSLIGLFTAAPGVAQAADGGISGTVTTYPSKTALAGVEVVIYNSSDGYVTATQTESKGSYTVSGLPKAEYKVAFVASEANYITQYYNDKSTLAAATKVPVNGATVTGVNAELVAGGEIEGTVTDQYGDPLPETEVQVYNASHDLVSTGQSNLDGEYTVSGLAAGSYVVEFVPAFGDTEYAPQYYSGVYEFKEATEVSVLAGEDTNDINAKLAEAGRLEGTVTDALSKTGLEGVLVQVYDISEPDTLVAPVETSSTGIYGFGGLAPGNYKVEFTPTTAGYSTQFYKDESTLAAANEVKVSSGVTSTEINAALSAGGRISGTVTSAATKDPLSEVEVSVLNSSGEYVQSVQTESNGTYTVIGLPNGSYEVEFLASAGGYARQYYEKKATLAEATKVTVSSTSAASNVNAALASEGSITGTVTNASNKDLEGIEVLVYDSAEEPITSADTESDGAYKVEGLAAGKYKVQFVSASGEYISQYYSDKAKFSEANEVTVTAGASAGPINAAMAVGGGSVSGTVTSAATGKPIAKVAVKVYEAGVGHIASALSATNGTYTVSGLTPGSYEIEFVPPSDAYLTQYYGGVASLEAESPVAVSAGKTTTGINAALKSPGEISGTVTSAATSAALAGVEVEVYDSHGTFVAFADSGANGAYTVSGLPTGSYVVEFAPPGGYLGQYYNGALSLEEAGKVAVTAGSDSSGIDAALASAGGISGTVTSVSTHDPLAEVEVQVYLGGQLVGSAKTAASGTYTVGGLGSGGYTVEFVALSGTYARQFYDGSASAGGATGVSVGQGETKAGVDAELGASGQISGAVTSAASQAGLSGVEVTVYDSEEDPVASTTSASGGTYTVSGLPAGEYEVKFSPGTGNYLTQFYDGKATLAEAGKVPVTAGASTGSINAALAAGGEISGTVYKPGGTVGAPGVEVAVYESSGESKFVGSATTTANGTYTVPGLPAGNYEVQFTALESDYPAGEYAPQYYNGASTLADATPVAVTAGADKSPINATLAAPGAIAGKVTAAATSAALSGVVVKIYDLEDDYVTSAETAASGEYTVSGLAAGEYEVEFVPSAAYLAQYYKGVPLFSEATVVTVKNGSTQSGIDAALAKPGTIAGTVTSAASPKADLQGVEVKVFDAAGGAYVTSAETAANGTYTVPGLAEGKYKVQFLASSGNYVPQYYKDEPTLAAASEVKVSAGASTAVSAELATGGQITGTVTSSATTHETLAHVQVAVYQAGVRVATTETASGGTYTVSGLGTGNYEVEFSTPGAYLSQFWEGKYTLAEAKPVPVSAGSPTMGIDAALAPAYGSLSGTVTGAGGAPLEHIEVKVYGAVGYAASVETAANGTYTVAGLTPGKYEVQFVPSGGGYYLRQYYGGKSTLAEASPVTVTAGQTTTAVNAALASAGKISGTVTDAASNAPLGHVEVKVYDSSDGYVASAETTSSGEYTVSGLLPGNYEVGFAAGGGYAPQFYAGSLSLEEANPVPVTADATTSGIDAALVVGGGISGTVTDAATHLPMTEAVEVNVYDAAGSLAESEETGPEGTYTVQALPPGSYAVEFHAASTQFAVQFYNGASSLATATRVPVSAGITTPEINAAMAPPTTEPPGGGGGGGSGSGGGSSGGGSGGSTGGGSGGSGGSTGSTTPQLSLAGPISSKSGDVLVPLRCPAGASGCAPGRIEVTIVEQLRKGRLIALAAKKHSPKSTVVKRTVVLGTLAVTLGAGQTQTFKVPLNGAATALLKTHAKLLVKVQVLVGATTIATQNVTVTRPAKKVKKSKKRG